LNAANLVWTTDADGDDATVAFTDGSNVIFSAGSDVATGTVTVGAALGVSGMTFQEGSLSLIGDRIITVGSGGITVDAGVGSNLTRIGDSGSTKVRVDVAQTWTNNSTGSLIIGGTSSTASQGINAQVTLVGPGRILLGNDATSNSFDGGANGSFAIGTSTATGNVMLSAANAGFGGLDFYLVNGSITNGTGSADRAKGVNGSDFILQGAFTLNVALDTGTLAATSLRLDGNHVLTMGANSTSSFAFQVENVVQNGGTILNLAGSGFFGIRGVSSTYTGGTILSGSGGTLRIAGDGSLGVAPGTATTNITFQESASILITASTILNANRSISVASTKTATFNSGSTSTNSFEVTGVISGDGSVTAAGSGTVKLSGLNTYTGITTASAGILEATILANGGVASSIGSSGNSAANLRISSGATLKYIGTALSASTDRLFQIGTAGSGQTGTLDASGTGTIHFTNTGAITYGTAGTNATNQSRVLVLRGTNTGLNQLDATIGNNAVSLTSVTKNDAGTWRLNGALNYTGATTVNGGVLILDSTGPMASAITVTAGTLKGGSTTSGAIAIGDGVGSADAIFAAGSSPGTFTTTSTLLFNSDGVFAWEIDSSLGTADKLVAAGVTVNALALFTFNDVALTSTALAMGTQYTIIDNTAAGAFSGAFSNLAEGSTFSVGANTFQASYLGGTGGNDLVLTVVPEPRTGALLIAGLGAFFWLARNRRRK
jgi:fibronectin-binding autotransporter adhesin